MAPQPSYAQVLMHMALRYFNLISTNIQSKIFIETIKNTGIYIWDKTLEPIR
jgi:hypothetical protein